jgi:phosphocarrier protein HPr
MNADEMLRSTVTICNIRGLHARAAAKFVKTVANYNAKVQVVRADSDESDGDPVNGSSILGLMMMAADKGSSIQISSSGVQAEEVLKALCELVENRFGEDE